MIDRMTRWVETGLGLVLIASVLLNCANIAGRYFFNTTLISADELQIFGMIAITFLGLFIVSWRGAHLRMDILVHAMPGWLRALLKILERLLICAVSILVIAMSWEYVTRMHMLGVRSENAEIPMWILHAIVTTGMSLVVLVTLAQILLSLTGKADTSVRSSPEAE